MGAYDGAEVCELVGTYMLNLLSKKYNKNDFGLYCDDVLAVLKKQKWTTIGTGKEKHPENIQGTRVRDPCKRYVTLYLAKIPRPLVTVRNISNMFPPSVTKRNL